jgi:DNA-binding transcriptional MerR regulator
MAEKAYYSVKQVSELSGVSVRTLHLYDEMNLLKPGARTEARYRMYGEKELLRLQQILFYKELGFSLERIRALLDDPGFDLFSAMEEHREALLKRRDQIETLVTTIDKTILQLKKQEALKPQDLYEGLPREVGSSYRDQAMEKYGKEEIERSEKHLLTMEKIGFERLKLEAKEISEKLFSLQGEDHTSDRVQRQVARHYASIRQFWGTVGLADKQAEAYKGLGQLYVADERFTMHNGKAQPAFALFLSKAMAYFADTALGE